jgi:GNAT superfamily N-acetyltransferase
MKDASVTMEHVQARHAGFLKCMLEEHWGSTLIVVKGHSRDAMLLPGIVVKYGDEYAGLGIYQIHQRDCEIVCLAVTRQWQGIGTYICNAIEANAREHKCERLWGITTNDNIDALRFYQCRGFALCALYPNAVRSARLLKPSIPLVGNYGIPICDEIEFEKALRGAVST